MESVTRNVIAKLLATENITVVQGKISTAMFDVKNRILMLPMWKDIFPHTEDHLIGHEVGHALYTPEEGWHEAVCSKGPGFKSYLNVVEDARIEKLMLRKYPGLKTSFIKSYRELLAQGFFGSDLESINKMGFIDRINTYFKCGESSGVTFVEEEETFVKRIKALETWEQVVKISEELYAYCKEKYEEEQNKKAAEGEEEEEEENDSGDAGDYEMSEGESDGDSEEMDDYETGESGQDEFDNLFNKNEYESEDNSNNGPEGGRTNHDLEPAEPDISSKTDESLRENIGTQIYKDSESAVHNLTMDPMENWKNCTFSYKDIIKDLKGNGKDKIFPSMAYDSSSATIEEYGSILYKDWQKTNLKAVSHMVKEFEMRKSASEYARVSTSKTGVLDTLKMNNYKLTDDIFKRVSVIPEGKNHGFIMYLDMSGSMSPYMYNTVEQTLVLAQFCKQINVSFRVYGFTDYYHVNSIDSSAHEPKPNQITQNPGDGYLLELFSDKMKSSEMSFMAKSLLTAYIAYDRPKMHQVFEWRNYSEGAIACSVAARIFNLGGTPLNKSIAMAIPIATDFRKKEKIDILNTFFITDGCSHGMEIALTDDEMPGRLYNSTLRSLVHSRRPVYDENGDYKHRSSGAYVTVTNTVNKKTYKMMKFAGRNMSETDILLKMYKDVTGSIVVGYRIETQTKNKIENICKDLKGVGYETDVSEFWDSVKKNGWCKVENAIGYDEMFVIGSKSVKIIDNKMESVASGSLSKAKLRTVFSKSQNTSKKSRKMLTELVKLCA
jgi:hypothetical protein